MRRGISMITGALGLALVACTGAGARDTVENREPGSAPQRLVPAAAQPPADAQAGPRRVVQITAGLQHSCALFEDGGVRCWGEDEDGRLGAGPTLHGPKWEEGVREGRRIAATIPEVELGGRAVQIAAGGDHTCALLDTGKVRCWGAAASGQLGYGYRSEMGSHHPVFLAGNVKLDEPVTQVVAGWGYTCALLASGRVRCWGTSSQGELGQGPDQGDLGDDEAPTAAPALELGGRVTQLSASMSSPCALLADGSVRCWGQVRGSSAGTSTPAAEHPLVALGAPAVRIASSPAADHTCAITAAGHLRCWGDGKHGEVGHASDTGEAGDVGVAPGKLPTPDTLGDVPLAGAGRVTGVAPGGSYTCALLDAGKVRCWGESWFGALGPGRPARVPARGAVEIDIGGRVVEIVSGALHSCALLDTGRVRCWGANFEGQLGYGLRENVGEQRAPAAVGDVPL
jgi:alpha-tubulin suppressor-like RCC1 family protein